MLRRFSISNVCMKRNFSKKGWREKKKSLANNFVLATCSIVAALKLPELSFETGEVPSEGEPARTLGTSPVHAGQGSLTWDSRGARGGEKSPAVLPAGKRLGKLERLNG